MTHGYWATIEHMRTWDSFDGPMREKVIQDGGLTGFTAAAIAIEYGLMNSLPWRGGFGRFPRVAKIVNRNAAGIPTSANMEDKLAAVTQVAEDIMREFELGKLPTSAASKLFWFVSPGDWTMFDKHAFNGLIKRKKKNRAEDMDAFYAKLSLCRFGHYADLVMREGAACGQALNGERLLDKYLMLSGSASKASEAEFGNRVRRECEIHLQTADGPRLKEIAERISRLLQEFSAEIDRAALPR